MDPDPSDDPGHRGANALYPAYSDLGLLNSIPGLLVVAQRFVAAGVASGAVK
ncbi:MAG TPA: hypothetical protein VD903_15775 [Pseudonocardia sp.]|nr:hypothetical protein [Pseudonocardia sp.]